MAEVVLADPEDGGLAAMLAGLLSAAIERPEAARILDRMSGTVTIAVTDADVEVGLRFGNGTCRVHAQPIPAPTLRIESPAAFLLGMSTMPLLFGLPSPLHNEGRQFLRQLRTGNVRIRGLLRHLRLVTQLNRLLAVP